MLGSLYFSNQSFPYCVMDYMD